MSSRPQSRQADTAEPSVIYDFGMNNGDDVAYYLLKGHRVVGVEANSDLCAEVEERFAREIETGRLKVLNVALAENESAKPIDFYVHRHNHVLSQLPKPPADQLDQFRLIQVPCRTPASIVREFGEPVYVKVDVEHFDLQVLQNLFAAGIYPPEISAESHSINVFACLVANGYQAFNLVEGGTVGSDYGDATVTTLSWTNDTGRTVEVQHETHGFHVYTGVTTGVVVFVEYGLDGDTPTLRQRGPATSTTQQAYVDLHETSVPDGRTITYSVKGRISSNGGGLTTLSMTDWVSRLTSLKA